MFACLMDTGRLNQVLKLLQTEREDDQLQYNEDFLKNNISYRKQKGITWYPVQITGSEIGLGEYLIIDVERTTDTELQHQFSNGKNITLFSNLYEDEKPINGTIKLAQKNRMRIALTIDELPDWCNDGKLGVNLAFDEASYKESESAMENVIQATGRLAHLRDVVEGVIPPSFRKIEECNLPDLNPSQNAAVTKILSAKDIALVHGPPGTGKTTTLIHAIQEVLKTEKQVLFCSGSNTAVDLLTEKLHQRGVNVLRLGNPVRISEDVLSSTLDAKVMEHPSAKEIKNYRKRAEEFFRMAGKYKRILGREEKTQRQLLYLEAKKIIKEARELEDFITEDILDKASVIACTPVISAGKILRNRKFTTLFYDEAGQSTEPMCWIPIQKCERFILAGDHLQLPPTVKSKRAAGLSITLFEHLMKIDNSSVMLDVQYRMNEKIMAFSSKEFYDNKLKSHPAASNHVLDNSVEDTLLKSPLLYIDTAGCSYDEKLNPETISVSNPDEATLLIKHLTLLLETYYSKHKDVLRIGIISPYKEQTALLEELIQDSSLNNFPARISVKTIDGFQGQERDIIYISLVRSNDNKDIGFLNDTRRMNVALTRARKKLVVIGDSATLSNHPFYKDFIQYAEENDAYVSAWEFYD